MNRFKLYMVLALLSTALWAQTMNIHKSDGSSEQFYLRDVHQIAFDTKNTKEVGILANYVSMPNSFFISSGQFHYSLKTSALVQIEVFDISGQLISTLENSYQAIGDYSLSLKSLKNKSGVYLIRSQINGQSYTRKYFVNPAQGN